MKGTDLEFIHMRDHAYGYMHIYMFIVVIVVIMYILRCEDYIQISDGASGITELCGNNTLQPLVHNNSDTNVIFRTSESIQGVGFQMLAICFRETDTNLPGMNDSVMVCILTL